MKITGTLDGKQVEVEVADGSFVSPEQLAESYMPKAAFKTELDRRAESIAAKKLADQRTALLDDESFKSEFATKHGLKAIDDKDTAKLIADQVAQREKDWNAQRVTPLEQKLAESNTRIGRLLESKLTSQMLLAAADPEVGISKAILREVGGKPMIVAMLGHAFGYDEKTDNFYVRKGDTFEFSANPTDAAPYMTVGEYLKKWAADKANASFVEDRSQRGSNQGDSHRSGAKDVVLTRAQAKDVRQLMAAKERAAKQGGEVLIEE